MLKARFRTCVASLVPISFTCERSQRPRTCPTLPTGRGEPMTQRMSQTLAEFGRGFAFYGRQFHLDAQGGDFYIDLLLVHVPTNRFVTVELKSGKFRPEHLGQLNFYVAAVNDLVKFPEDVSLTVGILVCGSKHEPTVRYALDGSSQPVAVSSYTYDSLLRKRGKLCHLRKQLLPRLSRERWSTPVTQTR